MTECLKKFLSLSLNNIMFRASLDASLKNKSKISEYFALPWCLVCLLHNHFFFASLSKQGPGWEHMFIMKFFHCRSMLSRQHRPIHIQEICHQLPQGPASSTQVNSRSTTSKTCSSILKNA